VHQLVIKGFNSLPVLNCTKSNDFSYFATAHKQNVFPKVHNRFTLATITDYIYATIDQCISY